MLLGLYRKLFPLVCALKPKCLAVGSLIHIRQLPARFSLSTQLKEVFGHSALQRFLPILGVNF